MFEELVSSRQKLTQRIKQRVVSFREKTIGSYRRNKTARIRAKP